MSESQAIALPFKQLSDAHAVSNVVRRMHPKNVDNDNEGVLHLEFHPIEPIPMGIANGRCGGNYLRHASKLLNPLLCVLTLAAHDVKVEDKYVDCGYEPR